MLRPYELKDEAQKTDDLSCGKREIRLPPAIQYRNSSSVVLAEGNLYLAFRKIYHA